MLLVGSAEYGNADFGRTGGEPSIMTVAQEEQEPATFEVEAVVNARGGLEVRLTAIPGSPTLSIQFMVRGDTNPHRLVDPGTLIYILGIAKEGVTAFRSADDIASLMFFATVPSATAASTDSTMQGPPQETFLFAELTTLILGGGQIRTPQNKVLLVQEDLIAELLARWLVMVSYFGCCEIKLRLGLDDKTGKPLKPSNAKGKWQVVGGDTVIEIQFDIVIVWECDNRKEAGKLCRGAFLTRITQKPQTVAPKKEDRKRPKEDETNFTKVSGDPDRKCEEAKGPQVATIRVTYKATYKGVVQVKTPPHLVINIWVWDDKRAGRGDHGIWHSVVIEFDTNKQDEKTGVFPVKVRDPKMMPPPPKK